jgi:hypothetical protein
LKLLKENNPLEGRAKGGLICSFSTRASGNMSLAYGDISGSLGNRRNFLSSLGIDYLSLVCAKQAHGNNVRYVNEADEGSGVITYDNAIPNTDGFITDVRNLPLAIFTADCPGVFLYDPRKPAVGLIHAGWRSSKENILQRAVELMRAKFNSRAEELIAGFGPAIGSCCYEVSGEFRGYFPSELIEKGGRFYLDLPLVNKRQLIASGLKDENISVARICTHCNSEDFFSFRREGKDTGRMLSVIMLR